LKNNWNSPCRYYALKIENVSQLDKLSTRSKKTKHKITAVSYYVLYYVIYGNKEDFEIVDLCKHFRIKIKIPEKWLFSTCVSLTWWLLVTTCRDVFATRFERSIVRRALAARSRHCVTDMMWRAVEIPKNIYYVCRRTIGFWFEGNYSFVRLNYTFYRLLLVFLFRFEYLLSTTGLFKTRETLDRMRMKTSTLNVSPNVVIVLFT